MHPGAASSTSSPQPLPPSKHLRVVRIRHRQDWQSWARDVAMAPGIRGFDQRVAAVVAAIAIEGGRAHAWAGAWGINQRLGGGRWLVCRGAKHPEPEGLGQGKTAPRRPARARGL